MADQSRYIKEIIGLFESRVPGSIAVHTGYGAYSDDDDIDEVLCFEVLNVKKEDYRAYLDTYTEVLEKIAWSNGFTVSVHALSPDAVKKHRKKEYRLELAKRNKQSKKERDLKPRDKSKILKKADKTRL